MTLAVLFWVLMVVSLVLGFWVEYVPGQPFPFRAGAHSLLLWVLLAILGYAQFGGLVK